MKRLLPTLLAAIFVLCLAGIVLNRFVRLSEVADKVGWGPAIIVFLIIVGLISLVDNLGSCPKGGGRKQRGQDDSRKA